MARDRERTKVEIATPSRLVATAVKNAYYVMDLVSAITPENRHDETDLGTAIGREIW